MENGRLAAKSLVGNLRRGFLLAIIASSVSIAIIISYLSYVEFLQRADALQSELIEDKKQLVQDEVERVVAHIEYQRSVVDAKVRERIRERIEEAHAIASNIYSQFHGKLPEAKVKAMIVEALRPLRFFGGDGYYFVGDLDGVMWLHALKPEIEGQNRLDKANAQGRYLSREIIEIVKSQGEGYLEDYAHRSFGSGREEIPKIGFVKLFEPYDWYIGTGDYIDNVRNSVQREMLDYIGKVRFGENGYIFVINDEGVVLMNGMQSKLVGKNILGMVDSRGLKVVEEEIRIVRESGEGYLDYYWHNPSLGVPSRKISFVKGVPEWGWIVGAGLYTDDVDAAVAEQRSVLQREQFERVALIAVISLLASLLVLYVVNMVSRRFTGEVNLLMSFFRNQALSSEEKVDLALLQHDELREVAESANRMIDRMIQEGEKRSEVEERLRHSHKMEALGKLTGGVAHDYNNMLAIILGYTELLLAKLEGQRGLQNYVGQIKTAAERASALTAKLLAFSRGQASTQVQTDLCDELRQHQQMLAKTLTARIQLRMELPDSVWPIEVDRDDLANAVVNMAINASHAIAEQGMLAITVANETLQGSRARRLGLAEGDFVRLTLTDDGCGMDRETKLQAFDPFFTTKGERGTGLGLSQVYGFVQRSGGGIQVDSTPGEGTTISIYFPRRDKGQRPHEGERPEAETIRGSETVLVVDDEPALSLMAAEIIESAGYRVVSATDGEEALRILQSQPVDLLFSDVIMPGINGYQLATRVKERYPDVAVLLVSGYKEVESLPENEQPERELFNHITVMHKPYTASELLRSIRVTLDSPVGVLPPS